MTTGDLEREAIPGVAPFEDDAGVVMQLDVDGEVFELRADERGGMYYAWISGPNPGYGFGVSPVADSAEQHRENIRNFLAMIDPRSGYIGDG